MQAINSYGINKYEPEKMYWMGYIYRYWAYIYEISSKRLYELYPGSKLYEKYDKLSSLKPEYVIDDIMNSENIELLDQNDYFDRAKSLISERLKS